MSPKDPLLQIGPEREREVFKIMVAKCLGLPHEITANLAINLLINTIRQRCETRENAEADLRDMFGKAANILLEQHYDGHGRKKGIFPYDQVITVPLIDLRSKH